MIDQSEASMACIDQSEAMKTAMIAMDTKHFVQFLYFVCLFFITLRKNDIH